MVEKSREIPKGIDKDYRKVLEAARDQGFEFGRIKGHPMAYSPDTTKSPVPIPTTPASRKRSFENFVASMRRAGLKWPPPK